MNIRPRTRAAATHPSRRAWLRRLLPLLGAVTVVPWTVRSPARADDGSAAGLWRGPWYLGMSSGTATLVIAAGATDGTLQFTNNDAFGDTPVPLRELRVADGALRFVATGADGKRMVCDLPVDLAGGRLKGFVTYGGYKLRLELVRVPSG